MPKLQHAYKGSENIRILLVEDFAKMGASEGETSWDPSNGHVVEVSDPAAKWLLENEPGDWSIASETAADESSSSSDSSESSEMTAELSETTEAASGASTTTRSGRR